MHAVVFDGTYGNQSTAVKLGCEIEAENMKTWFSHPDDPQSKKRFTEMVVHKNEPSLRHRLTKTILFKNQ